MAQTPETIQIEDFLKVDLRTARVLEACDHPNADKLIILKVDLGGEQRQICAGLRGHYTPEQLVGKTIIVVANLAGRTMRGEESQGMLLAASNPEDGKIILLTTDSDVPPGARIS